VLPHHTKVSAGVEQGARPLVTVRTRLLFLDTLRAGFNFRVEPYVMGYADHWFLGLEVVFRVNGLSVGVGVAAVLTNISITDHVTTRITFD
jgi:hypothetical protein